MIEFIIIIIIFIFLQTGYNYIDGLIAIYRHRILYAVQKWRRGALVQSAFDAKNVGWRRDNSRV